MRTGKQEYSKEILKNAVSLGYKTANLMNLTSILIHFPVSNIRVSVPKFIGISHDQMMDHLDQYGPCWRDQWADIKEAYRKQSNPAILAPETKEKIKILQDTIKEIFSKNIFSSQEIDNHFIQKELVMVRSTGKEDSTEMANPGGNASVPCLSHPKNLMSDAMGEVIASYMGEKSLSQRLKAGDDITTDPFIPILIQTFVGEEEIGEEVYSGVIYTGNGASRIQVAPGHGELIVNSKGNFDNYYITSNDMVYSEVHLKDFRLKAEFDSDQNKMRFIEITNTFDLQHKPSLSENNAYFFHKVAQYVEDRYGGMRMDIEFVYKPREQTLYLVQARTVVSKDDRKLMVPSALDPIFLNKLKEEGGKQLKGSVITPEINNAVVINDSSQIYVGETVEEALSSYTDATIIKAVVVKNKAPDTSHEAGEFNFQGIPVLQISDIHSVETFGSELKEGQTMIVDPQRKSVFQLPKQLRGLSTQELLAQGILKEGLFRSSLSANVSSEKPLLPKIEDKSIPQESPIILNESLGHILMDAQNGDEMAAKQLLDFIWQKLLQDNATSPKLTTDMTEKLEILSNPYSSDGYDRHMAALKALVLSYSHLFKAQLISQKIYVKSMLTATELTVMIDKMSQQGTEDKVVTEYLNVFEKLQGISLSGIEKDVLSSSIATELGSTKHEKAMLNLALQKKYYLTDKQQAIFTQVSKLTRYFLDDESKENWIEFCLENLKDEQRAISLATLVGKIVKLNLHPLWANVVFAPAYKNSAKSSNFVLLDTLISEYLNDIASDQDVKQAGRIIKTLEKQAQLWCKPEKFLQLYEKLPDQINQIIQLLAYQKDTPILIKMLKIQAMNELTDAMDKSIKSLCNSTFYGDKLQQTDHFRFMLIEFSRLLLSWSQGILNHNGKPAIKYKIEHMLTKKSDERDLLLSGKFEVASALITLTGITSRGWGRILSRCETLGDCFTLIHQNIVACISKHSSKETKPLMDCSPEIIKEFQEELNFLEYKATLNNITMDNNALLLQYNIALRDHSAKFNLKYDYINHKTTLEFLAFGENENRRWDVAELYNSIEFDLNSEIGIEKHPRHNTNKYVYSFAVALRNSLDVVSAINAIDEVSTTSMKGSIPERALTPKHQEIIRKCPLEKLEKFIQFFENKRNEFVRQENRIGISWLDTNMVYAKYYLESKKDHFDFIKFCIENTEILSYLDIKKKLGVSKKTIAAELIERGGIPMISEFGDLIPFSILNEVSDLFSESIKVIVKTSDNSKRQKGIEEICQLNKKLNENRKYGFFSEIPTKIEFDHESLEDLLTIEAVIETGSKPFIELLIENSTPATQAFISGQTLQFK